MLADANPFSALLVAGLVAAGVAAGFVGGLAGVGGGLVMIPVMIFAVGDRYGPEAFHLFKLASISTSFVLSIPAAARHIRARAVLRGFVPAMAPGALAGTLAGVVAAGTLSGPQTHWLTRAFGVLMILSVGLRSYVELRAVRGDAYVTRACPTPRRFAFLASVIGAPAGLVAGLFGVAGGIWAVPVQNLLGILLRNAIANSTVLVGLVALVTACSQSLAVAQRPSLHLADAFLLAACLAPGAMLGGWIGAGLTHRIPTRWLSRGLNVVLVLTGLRLAFG